MEGMIATSNRRAVIGAGVTGRSVARFLSARDLPFDWYDTRESLAQVSMSGVDSSESDLTATLQFGEISEQQLVGYDELIVSPGIANSEDYIAKAKASGSRIIGDIELFARQVEAPVAAITGSNGKTSVTSLLTEVAKACGLNAVAAGNIGEPVLDLLNRDYDLFVLELSSFQLENTSSLEPAVAVILNMSPDHMDRYPSMIDYHAAKQRIHTGAARVISNRDDLLTQPMLADFQTHSSFGFEQPDLGHYGIRLKGGIKYLACGLDCLVPLSEIQLQGSHNLANAMAVLAMADSLNLDRKIVLQSICKFKGLAHRCELVSVENNRSWINDSKATNTGAAIAAIKGICDRKSYSAKLILIAGGQTKDQDFAEFGKLVASKASHILLLGEGAQVVAEAINCPEKTSFVETMEAAVIAASELAQDGDCILLSPACASFDQFEGYEDRGEQFRSAVEALR